MALINSKICPLSCFASTNPNSLPKFLVSKFHGTVDSSSPANTTKRSSPSNFNLPVSNYLRRLDMIDNIQGLGIDFHFLHEIDQILHIVYKGFNQNNGCYDRDLREVALCFRLLRQEGHNKHPRQEEWIQNDLQNDVKGLIELYEASELGVEGEEILDSLRECTFTRLNELCSGRDSHEEREIMNSLAQPRHKTLRRLTSNKFISIIKIGGEEDNEWLQSLLRVAECDSIMLKSLIREEIPQAFKAEEGKKLATEMAYMVPGILQEPCFSEQRLDLTKPISLVYIIDDIFDVYGELDELTIFTQVVESGLICSERSWSKQNGLIRVTYQILRSNGFVSSGVHLVMLHLLGEEITTGKVELIESIPKIVSSAATILRLWDDLGSAKCDDPAPLLYDAQLDHDLLNPPDYVQLDCPPQDQATMMINNFPASTNISSV
ncbi:hypothetical protein HID58_033024 [Brassica napus]|uniref:Terpene synthase N-terminal domain-containing protein n=1 Tax=Brassica napus TaxID=3708 RepID=A0ABQ8BY44_BRANA|nr:hypothetical protein HID58_033024 [Brassica napus]